MQGNEYRLLGASCYRHESRPPDQLNQTRTLSLSICFLWREKIRYVRELRRIGCPGKGRRENSPIRLQFTCSRPPPTTEW